MMRKCWFAKSQFLMFRITGASAANGGPAFAPSALSPVIQIISMDAPDVNGIAFHTALRAVLADDSLSSRDKVVMTILLDFSRQDGVAWPSLSTIAAAVKIDRRRVVTSLNDLKNAGWLSVVAAGGGRSSTKYQIRLSGDALSLVSSDKASPQQCPDVTPAVANTTSSGDKASPNRLMTDLVTVSSTALPAGGGREVTNHPPLEADGWTPVKLAVNDFYSRPFCAGTLYSDAKTAADRTSDEAVIEALRSAKAQNEAAGKRVMSFAQALSSVVSKERVAGYAAPEPKRSERRKETAEEQIARVLRSRQAEEAQTAATESREAAEDIF